MKNPLPEPPRGAPPGTQWFGGPIGWLRVSLFVQSEELAPAFITDLFGIAPDHAKAKGVPLLRADGAIKRAPKCGAWEIELKRKQTDE